MKFVDYQDYVIMTNNIERIYSELEDHMHDDGVDYSDMPPLEGNYEGGEDDVVVIEEGAE